MKQFDQAIRSAIHPSPCLPNAAQLIKISSRSQPVVGWEELPFPFTLPVPTLQYGIVRNLTIQTERWADG